MELVLCWSPIWNRLNLVDADGPGVEQLAEDNPDHIYFVAQWDVV